MIRQKINTKNSAGYTLAEVLITLVIIGVVATMTIPSILAQKEKQEYVTKIKKTYTTLEQVILRAKADNGDITIWDYGTVSSNGAEAVTFANTYLIPYLNVAKNCGTGTGCWVAAINRFDGTQYANYGDTVLNAKFILSDGTAIEVTTLATSAMIHFDINGLKGPNIYGKDIFAYLINPNSPYSIGLSSYKAWDRTTLLNNAGNGCNKTSTQPDACLTLIIKDGWQILDDYPW